MGFWKNQLQLEYPEPSKTLFTDFPSSCLQYFSSCDRCLWFHDVLYNACSVLPHIVLCIASCARTPKCTAKAYWYGKP